MKTIQFTLSMPNRGSWNGRWSGEETLYARVVNLNEKVAERVLAHSSHYYNFGDGWGASVAVKVIDGKEARRVRRLTKGFCGYDWMIDSIIADGTIYGPTRPKPELTPVAAGDLTPKELSIEDHRRQIGDPGL